MEALLNQITLCNIPTKDELVSKRALHVEELIPEEDDWEGWLGEDADGVYIHACEFVAGDFKPHKGTKVHVAKFYDQLEERILDYYRRAMDVYASLKDASPWQAVSKAFELLRIDACLSVLHYYHASPPDYRVVLTNEQLDEVLANESTLSSYMEMLNSLNIDRCSTPLGVGNMLKSCFRRQDDIRSVISVFSGSVEDFALKTLH